MPAPGTPCSHLWVGGMLALVSSCVGWVGDLAGEDQVLNCDVEQFGEGLEEF